MSSWNNTIPCPSFFYTIVIFQRNFTVNGLKCCFMFFIIWSCLNNEDAQSEISNHTHKSKNCAVGCLQVNPTIITLVQATSHTARLYGHIFISTKSVEKHKHLKEKINMHEKQIWSQKWTYAPSSLSSAKNLLTLYSRGIWEKTHTCNNIPTG